MPIFIFMFIYCFSFLFPFSSTSPEFEAYLKDNAEEKFILGTMFAREGEYLQEFIDYYFKIGFDIIYLIDNNQDKSDDFYINNVKHPNTHFISRRNMPYDQSIYYKTIYDHMFSPSYWFAFLDLDEYICFTGNITSIKEYIKIVHSNNCSNVRMNWQNYGNNGHLKKTPGTMLERFTIPSYNVYIHDFPEERESKVLVRGGINGSFGGGHNFIPQNNSIHCCNANFSSTICSDFKTNQTFYNHIYIKHFFTKSEEEWKIKLNKWNEFKPVHSSMSRYSWKSYNAINSIFPNVPYRSFKEKYIYPLLKKIIH